MSRRETRKEYADRLWRYSNWIYGAIAAFLLAYSAWHVARAVWGTGLLAGRVALVVTLSIGMTLAVRDLKRRRLGVFTGLVWGLWIVVTLLVILFGDLYFLIV